VFEVFLEDVVIIHHEPRPDGSRQMPEVGIVIPAHASALGKAILAFDDDAASRMLATSPLRSMTGETLTSPIDLKEQLIEIGSTGLAHEQEEAVLGECALAGPVFDASGTPVGAIGLVVPSTNWPVDPATRDAVRDAARAISRELGGMSWPPTRAAKP
jgi:DNA-binding IclR family transcriptional regulator